MFYGIDIGGRHDYFHEYREVNLMGITIEILPVTVQFPKNYAKKFPKEFRRRSD